jgi:phospholipid transport system transporter-binding protein
MIRAEGDRLLVSGAITFGTVMAQREEGLALIAARDGGTLVVDLGAVGESDSSAVSLLFEWQRAALSTGVDVRYANLPAGMRSLAELYDVLDLIAVA